MDQEQQLADHEDLRERYLQERLIDRWKHNPSFRDSLLEFYEHGNINMSLKNVLVDMMIDYAKIVSYDASLFDKKQVASKTSSTYQITFGSHLMAGITVTDNNIEIEGAVDGWGNGIPVDQIVITKQEKDKP